MVVSSVLVAGEGDSSRAAAIALAGRGLDVTLVGHSPRLQDVAAGMVLPVGADLLEAVALWPGIDASAGACAARGRGREASVEERPGTWLVGSIAVDRHVEAELSDGRIENYDLVVLAGDGQMRLITGGDRAPSAGQGASGTGALGPVR
ncbi:hypothetical protein GCM10022240_05810 [Microbacterium kribbense]|uniref:Uncharacterized protein n=2 Tax=Microbacterium kribbense TaxID=433645 RepID=A0ABP7G6E4_9MICO